MENRLHSIREAAEILGLGRDSVYAAINRGELISVTIGRRRLVSARAIEDYISRLETAQRGSPEAA